MYYYDKQNPKEIANAIYKIIESFNIFTKHISEATKNNEYLKVVCSYAQQSTEASSLLAMELLCSLPYSFLSTCNQNGDPGNGGMTLLTSHDI